MATAKFDNLKRGERVKITIGSGPIGRIVELRGPLGPNGMQVYRVLVEVREDQLEIIAST